MKVVPKSEATQYEAAGHFNYWSGRKLGAGTDTKNTSISYSHFLPGGGCTMSASPPEKVYFVISGSMWVKTKDGKEATLTAGDIVYFGPNEEREVKTVGNEVCTILVAIVKV